MSDLVSGSRMCRIELELGRSEPCPEEACPFWEGAGVAGDCAFHRVDFAGRHDLAEWLEGWRRALEHGNEDERDEAKRLFFERLNAEDGE